jgi:hypothetical protein
MFKLKIKKCVSEILDSLCRRNGFDDWWYSLDGDIEQEIELELESIVERRLNHKNTTKEGINKFIVDDVEIHLTDKQAANLLNQLHDFVYKQNGDSKFD